MAVAAVGRAPVCVAEICVGQEVAVSGRLDVNTVAEVRVALHDILDRGQGDLLVHLAQAEVYDCTGLAVIVGVHLRARHVGRALVLVDVSPRVDALLHASRLHRILARGPRSGVPAGGPAPSATVGRAETVVAFTP